MSTPIDPAIQAQIDAAVQQALADRDATIASLTAQVETLRGSQIAQSPVTEHGGGLGLDIAPTWGQYEQELARAGVHPEQ